MWVGFAGILPDCAEAWTRIGIRTPFAQIELRASRKVVLTDEGSEWQAAALEDAWAHYDRSLNIADVVEEGLLSLQPSMVTTASQVSSRGRTAWAGGMRRAMRLRRT